jgi:diguanylate cyclase (GGDEF)-like protein
MPQMIGTVEQVVRARRPLVTVATDATAAEVAATMSEHNVGCVLVTNPGTPGVAGIVSERDMLTKVAALNLNPASVPVSTIMSTSVVTCEITTPITVAEQLMAEHRIRHLPVTEKNIPVTMLSSRDIITYQLDSSQAMKQAAEQIARLSMHLKSLNFDEVVELIISEVPPVLAASRAALWFEPADPDTSGLARRIYRRNCTCPEKALVDGRRSSLADPDTSGASLVEICPYSRQTAGQEPAVIIRLALADLAEDPRTNRPATVTRAGLLCLCCLDCRDPGTPGQLILYKASLLREILEANLTNARLFQNYRQARRESATDPLTGLVSRRALQDKLEKEYARASRYRLRFCLAILDVDNFKQINDRAGHLVGDRALVQLARLVRRQARTTDIVARYGGDELVVLMPETEIEEAAAAMDRLRLRVATISLGSAGRLSISCGLAEWSPTSAMTLKQLFSRADAALYEAKRTGRNRVLVDTTHATHGAPG